MPPAVADAELAVAEYAIEGMTCASCAAPVERALARSEDVAQAAVNFATQPATVRLDPSTTGSAARSPVWVPTPESTGCWWSSVAAHWSSRPGCRRAANWTRRRIGWKGDGKTVVFTGWEGAMQGVLAVADTVKPDAAMALARLRELGATTVIITGDNLRTAAAIAAKVGIDSVLAEVLPADKVDELRPLPDAGRVVAMVGDGANDAPAPVQADLGIAVGTGTDVAIESSDFTLLSGDVDGVATAMRLSRRTLRTILQNLGWAFGYNVAAVALAMAGALNPIIAGAAMAFSSVSVVGNTLRLHRFRRD